jgi:uncharacterized membrane protein
MTAMFPCLVSGYGVWWIFPLVMIVMMVLCSFMMRGRMGPVICRPKHINSGSPGTDSPKAMPDIANKRHVRGEVRREEYEEKESQDRHD